MHIRKTRYMSTSLFRHSLSLIHIFIVVIVVSLATEAPTAEKIQGLVFGTATVSYTHLSFGVICSENPERNLAPLSASTTYHISVLPIEL